MIFRDYWADEDLALVEQYWYTSLFPLLEPIVSANTLPVPETASVRGIAAELRFEGNAFLGWISLPDTLPPLLSLPGQGSRYIPISEILLSKLGSLFPGYEIIGAVMLECFDHCAICIGKATDFLQQALQQFSVFHRQCPMDASILHQLAENPSFAEKKLSPQRRFRIRKHIPLQRILICPGQGELPKPFLPVLLKLSSQGVPVTIFSDPTSAASMQPLELDGCQIRCYPQAVLPFGGVILAVYGRFLAERFDLTVTTNDWSEKNSFLYETDDPALGLSCLDFFKNLWIGTPSALCPGTDLIDVLQQQTALGTRGFLQIYSDELTDENLVQALADAAGAGVKMRILSAGLCRLLPAWPNAAIRFVAALSIKKGILLGAGIGKKQQWYFASGVQQRSQSVFCPIRDQEASQTVQNQFQALWTDAGHTISASLYDLQKS